MIRKHKLVEIPQSVLAQISNLKEMPFEDLKLLWWETYQTKPPTNRRPYLERRLAFKLQEDAYRKHNPELMEKNKRRVDQLLKDTGSPRKAGKQIPEPGTVLIREYQGVQHQVIVTLDEEFEYRGMIYSSLSEIARVITGTRWSGPVFFGLRSATRPKKNKVAGGAK